MAETMNGEPELLKCRDTNLQVLNILTQISSAKKEEDVTEFKDNATTEITSTKFNPMDILLKQAIDSGALDPMVLNGLLDNVHLSNLAMKAKEEAKRDTTDNRGTIPTPLSSLTSQIEAKVKSIVDDSVREMEKRLTEHIDRRFDQLIKELKALVIFGWFPALYAANLPLIPHFLIEEETEPEEEKEDEEDTPTDEDVGSSGSVPPEEKTRSPKHSYTTSADGEVICADHQFCRIEEDEGEYHALVEESCATNLSLKQIVPRQFRDYWPFTTTPSSMYHLNPTAGIRALSSSLLYLKSEYSSTPSSSLAHHRQDQSVLHTLIKVEPGRGYRLADTGPDACFPTVKDVVQSCERLDSFALY
ncbi:hypothetical protein PROFUN_14378 [Planoprotostelium fungivorum]|uniref:Uncharacterized protein n=1 Tax=Planoprotostelium fungivorum TaxID=1890364 RepID=A0A2P6MVV5_9EUKA|nr:hypothetical protein PROFUN_14378 [Planoprotostelium fungivorum]